MSTFMNFVLIIFQSSPPLQKELLYIWIHFLPNVLCMCCKWCECSSDCAGRPAGRHTHNNGLLWEVVVVLSLTFLSELSLPPSLLLSGKLLTTQFVLPLPLFLLTFSSLFLSQYFYFLLQLKNSCTHDRSHTHTDHAAKHCVDLFWV